MHTTHHHHILRREKIMKFNLISLYFFIFDIRLGVCDDSQEIRKLFGTNQSEGVLPLGKMPKLGDLPTLNRKVFLGKRVSIEEHPYIVSVRRNYAHYLTGTLLTRTLIVTVAHPIDTVSVVELGVVAGENYNDRGAIILTVLLKIIHDDYDSSTLAYNLALLQVFEGARHSFKVKPINGLWISGKKFHGRTGFVTGWGRCDLTGQELCLPRQSFYYPDELVDPMLKTVKFSLLQDSSGCEPYVTQMDTPYESPKRNDTLCVGQSRAQRATVPCMGVPGAPLIVDGRLLGVASWGYGCGYIDDLPVVYADVRNDLINEWLNHNMDISYSSTRSNLTQIFQATRAFKMLIWVHASRHGHQLVWSEDFKYLEVLPLEDDMYVISRFKGQKYDVRDYIADGNFSGYKQKMLKSVEIIMNRTEKPETTQAKNEVMTTSDYQFVHLLKNVNIHNMTAFSVNTTYEEVKSSGEDSSNPDNDEFKEYYRFRPRRS